MPKLRGPPLREFLERVATQVAVALDVNEAFDEGKILAQTVVPVFDDDDASAVAARVLAQEHILFPRVVAAMCEDRIRFRSDGVPFIVDAE